MTTALNPQIRRHLAQFAGAGGRVLLDGDDVLLKGPGCQSLASTLRPLRDTVLAHLRPSVDAQNAGRVQGYIEPAQVHYIVDDAAAEAAVENVLADADDTGVIALDIETCPQPEWRRPIPIQINKDGSLAKRQPTVGDAGAALDPYRARIRLVQLYAGGDGVYVFDLDRVNIGMLALIWAQPLAAFNAVFEVKFLLTAGIEPSGRLFDVMTALWLTDGIRTGLGEAARRVLGWDMPKTLGASDWSAPALTQAQINYAALDAVAAFELWLDQREQFDEIAENVQAIADNAIVATARMELAGMPVDTDHHANMIKQWDANLAEAKRRLAKVTGITKATPVAKRNYIEAVIGDDTDRRAEWPRTDTGLLSADKKTLQMYGAEIDGIADMLEVSRLDKLVSTYGRSLADHIHPITRRIHGSFKIAGARTGRYSSSQPNLQNLPKRDEPRFRDIFAAPEGRVLVVADYSQIELRAAAEITGDEAMLEAFERGIDLHKQTARLIRGENDPDASVSTAHRNLAKALNFGMLYGAGAATFRVYAATTFGVELTLDEAAEARAAFFAAYPRLRQWQAEHARRSQHVGYVQTRGGRTWRWEWNARPSGEDDEGWDGFHYTYSLNHPIQGTCAEILMIAIAEIDRALRSYDARIVATVHDEIVIECADDPATVRAVARLMTTKMTRALLEMLPGHPRRGVVQLEVGHSWGSTNSINKGMVVCRTLPMR